MNRTEFVEAYHDIATKALAWSQKSLREGLLALEDEFDGHEEIEARDIFEYGLRLATDGYAPALLDKILSNIIAQEKDESLYTLKTIQKEAVLGIQNGMAPRELYSLLNSLTDIPLNEDKVKPGSDSKVIPFPKSEEEDTL